MIKAPIDISEYVTLELLNVFCMESKLARKQTGKLLKHSIQCALNIV